MNLARWWSMETFSEVIAAWYQANNWDWERLLLDSGKLQLVRCCQEPREIATASTVMRIAKSLLNEINAEDDIPYDDEFIKDIGQLESQWSIRPPGRFNKQNRDVHRRELHSTRSRTICPACLSETPNNLPICIRCHESLVSGGEICYTG